MADESKPQAGFLTGKKVEPAPAAEQTPQPPPPLDDGQKAKLVGFLKRGVMTKPAEPVPTQEEPPHAAAPTSNGTAPAGAKGPVAAAKAQAGTGSGKSQPARGQAAAKPAAAAAAAPAKAAPNRPLAEQHLHKGLDHYDRQETDQALVEYQECVKADPTFALGHNNLGMVLIDLERYDEAVESLYESIRCDPQYAEAYNNLGFVLRRTQRHVEAACAYEQFLQIEPDVEEGARIKGWVDTVLKENNLTELPPFTIPEKPAAAGAPGKIKKMAAWEVAVNSETAAPVSALGEILTDPMQDALKTASALPSSKRPDVPGQEAYRAAQAAAGTPASASQAAAKVGPQKPASKIGPGVKPPGPGGQPTLDSAVAKIEKGLDHFAEGELDQAAALFQQAIAEEPDNAEAHTGLGKVFVRQENFNGGIEELQKAIQIAPDDPAAYYVLGFALRAVERNIEASESYEKFLELMPEAVETEKMRQWIMHVKGAASVGIVEDNTVVEEEELTSETDQKYKAALQRFQDGDVDNSLRECVRILNEDAAHYRTRVLLGRIFLRQKQYDNAVEQLEGALVTRPDYPEALYFVGQAAEKRGTTDLAVQSYKRYIEVNPQGPRAERINEWLVMNGAGGDTASQMQCELCLRFFPGSEISQHEGKATCRNCLTVMGAAPASMEAPVANAQRAAADAALGTEVRKRGAPKGLIAVGMLAIIAGGIGALFFLGKLDPLLFTLGWKKRPDKPTDIIKPVEGSGDVVPKPISGALIAGEPQLQVSPHARWTYTPKLTGAESLDSDPAAKGWKKELKLKGGPPGMAVEGDSITWNPVPADWETLKAGETYPVEISIRGSWTGKENKVTELFAVAKSFVLNMQFGYDLGPEIDLDLKPSDQIALATGDLNGDGIADLVVCSGQFRTGALRFYINRGGGQLAAPASLASGSRFSAVWVGDLDGDRNDDLLAINWQTGKLTPYFRDGGLPVASTAIDLGPGPVALSVGKMDDGRNMYIAALQGVAHSLEITSLAPDRKFGELIRVPMPSGGPHAWIFPWSSAQIGTGFLTIVPLAENPIQLVTFNKGAWNKGGGTIQSGINDVGLVSGAAVLSGGAGKPQRLALIVTKTGNNSYLLMMEEKAGTFTPVGTKVPLQTPGLGLVARDFNQDGQDDLFVVTPEESIIYFCDPQSGELKLGPAYKTPKMRGAAVPMNVGNAARPDMLLLDENAKARILRASESK